MGKKVKRMETPNPKPTGTHAIGSCCRRAEAKGGAWRREKVLGKAIGENNIRGRKTT